MAQPYEMNNLVIVPSSVKTASFNTEHFRYVNCTVNCCIIYIDITAVSGTIPTLLVSLQALDPASLKWITLTGAVTASIVGTGTVMLTVGQGLTGVANSVINAILPNTLRLAFTVGGTSPSFTLSAGITFTA